MINPSKSMSKIITQAELFQSDFAQIAKFLAKSYNKKEQIEYLMNSKQTVVHTKDTLYTLSAITGDPRYLTINETRNEKPAMCEVAEAIFQIRCNERNGSRKKRRHKLPF